MDAHYFSQLHNSTDNRLWINNPTAAELAMALDTGAVACTTNPAYCARLIEKEPDYLNGLIDDVLEITADAEEAAPLVYQRAAKRVMDAYLGRYQHSGGTEGFVTIQQDPRTDEDAATTIDEIRRCRALSPNYMAKIPVIPGAFDAIAYCVAENIPICLTEVFAVSQARTACELYLRVSERTGNRPPVYVTHITGIFDEYLAKVARRDRIDINPEILRDAGLAVARKEYRMFADNGFPVTMMGGGAREMRHFTGLIGANVHITINWSTVREIIDAAPPVTSTIDEHIPEEVIDELRAKFPDFRRAWDNDGLLPGEYAAWGPVQLFRNAFLAGWYRLLAQIAARKNALAR